jgi:hypothetical protein
MDKHHARKHQYAAKWLARLREGAVHYDDVASYDEYLRRFRRDIGKRFTLADLGTSKEELDDLKIGWCKVCARTWFGCLREATDAVEIEEAHRRLREELAACNLTLEDIGTSEEFISSLVKKSA